MIEISTDEILSDIVDTQGEIEALRQMKPGIKVLDDRVLRMRIDAGIAKRTEFVAQLRRILDNRSEDAQTPPAKEEV
jgi:hypothetical protein